MVAIALGKVLFPHISRLLEKKDLFLNYSASEHIEASFIFHGLGDGIIVAVETSAATNACE